MLLTLAEVHAQHWSRLEHLLASIVDALGMVGHNALVGPHADPRKLRNLKPPPPLDRPRLRRRRKAEGGELVQFFAHARNPEKGG